MCDVNAVCINTIGSYDCQCQPPYFGDGSMCFRKYLEIMLIIFSILLEFQSHIRIFFFFFLLQVDLSYSDHNNTLV